MLNAIIVGASGYVGAELANYLSRHQQVNLAGLFVSEQSADAGKLLSELYPQFKHIIDLPIQPLSNIVQAAMNINAVFLATDHKVSHQLVPQFLAAGCIVFDLSGAYRVKRAEFYELYYGFTHQYASLLQQAVYGLAEWSAKDIENAQLIAVPGCYPTASQLALKPLIENELLDLSFWPVINAISGVSGAGRKASMTTSFCEVSLQPYGLFTHRHQPEIAEHLGTPVIFTPHLANFARGILATITCRLNKEITTDTISHAFHSAYDDKPLIRLYDNTIPALKSVVHLPFCDIGFALKEQHITIVATEDNLLKGAAAQAVQCFNIRFGFNETQSLL